MIKVEYQNGKFLMDVPFVLNHLVRNLPNRRWDAKRRVWVVPALRANCRIIHDTFDSDSVLFSEDAAVALRDSLLAKPRPQSAFPSWYSFKTEPRAKQREALDRAYGQKAMAMFMDMRTGKTKVVIDLACARRMENLCDQVLVVCPLSIRKNWLREIEAHAPIDICAHLLDTSRPKSFDAFLAQEHDFKWLVVGVESLGAGSAIKYCERFLLSSTRALMVVDESSKIKNHRATRSKNCVRLARMAESRLALTGTPIANGPMDIFMQFEFLDPDILGMGDFYSFRNRYAVMGGYEGKQIVGYANLPELTELIEPHTFQVRKEEVFPDAPPKIYVRREVKMVKGQRQLYDTLRKAGRAEIGSGSVEVRNMLEKMLRLQEVCGGWVTIDDERHRLLLTNPKIEELLECVEEYDGPTIIWAVFIHEIQHIVQALRLKYGDDQVVELYGAIDEQQRDINVNERFQKGHARFLVGNAATGGMGLTMSIAEVEIYFSNSFNYTDREQSEERAFGPHKKNGTLVVDLVCEDSVDEYILEALTQKKSVSEYVRGSIDKLKNKLFGV